ncbi:tyrosine-type recombinase/integrase [Nesterenkonia alkaliphila]|uniref:Tyrosine-type recombinase/integrase n=1 Tax=Nesterenkonia alkaliphila TaxID=1463631 RepID=A0A7K1UHS9_9MICC|nr:tyrosine-type recombinase/integrase [Nesterenkonia alkaliphila]MVT25942.1 tyrosine-type recombinase/integrase [Nesterenkonia alkaliphila]GGA00391.1 integrase [Nesterenkonia alkaliphila]
MTELTELIGDYLAFRESRGYRPNPKAARLLHQFDTWLPTDRSDGLLFSQDDAFTWADAAEHTKQSWRDERLSVVRGFAKYLAGSGFPVGIPQGRRRPAGSRRAIPYIYTSEHIAALMAAPKDLFTPWRAATMTTLVGLLAVTGIRIGEALAARIDDLDLDRATMLIAHGKAGRQRVVCLDETTCRVLAAHIAASPKSAGKVSGPPPLLVNSHGRKLSVSNVRGAFLRMIEHADLPPRPGARPRIHDLRHSFATHTMIDAYRDGRDPAATLAALSIWLGHADPANTYWYLHAAPELAAIAAGVLEPTPKEQS